MVVSTIRSVEGGESVSLGKVHATRGKTVRAEPIAAKYERGIIHHVGTFDLLEEEMCTYVPGGESPNRMDALVWAMTELMIGSAGMQILTSTDRITAEMMGDAYQ